MHYVFKFLILRRNPIGDFVHILIVQVKRIKSLGNSPYYLLYDDEANQIAYVLIDIKDG